MGLFENWLGTRKLIRDKLSDEQSQLVGQLPDFTCCCYPALPYFATHGATWQQAYRKYSGDDELKSETDEHGAESALNEERLSVRRDLV